MDVIEEKAVSVTGLMFTVPSYRKTAYYLLAFSFAMGFALSILLSLGKPLTPFFLSDALLYGGAEGVAVLALPALIAAALATTMVSRKEFRRGFRYFEFIALAGAVVTGAAYAAGLVLSKLGVVELYIPVFLGNSLVFILWLSSSYVALNYGKKAVILSLLQPIGNLALIVLWRASDIMGTPSPFVAVVGFVVSTAILLVALWSLFYLVNAPARRNFGISTVQAAVLFFGQWVRGSKGLEDILSEMGENATTLLGLVTFRTRRAENAATARGELGGKYKAFFLVPHVHFGPLGNLGGSEFPALLPEEFSKRYGKVPAFVFHSLTDHDFNPVYSSSAGHMAKVFEEMAAKQTKFSHEASFVFSEKDSARVFGFGFGDSGFLAISRAPKSTEDVEFPLGIALRNRAMRHFSEAVVVDCHNSKTGGDKLQAGEKEYFAFEEAIDALKPGEGKALKMGVAVDELKDFSIKDGIGGGGLKVAVFGIGGEKYCMALVDANNSLPAFRAEVLARLKKFGFDYCDIMTTDTHAVNAVDGIHNPLGLRTDRKKLTDRIDACVAKALNDMEPVEAAVSVEKIELEILGSKRASELTSTVSSIVAIMKVIAPAAFVLSVLAAFASLILLR